jgi:hypothetical protein
MPFVPRREYFTQADRGDGRPQCPDLIHGSLNGFSPLIKLWHKPGNRAAMTRNDNGFAPFDVG